MDENTIRRGKLMASRVGLIMSQVRGQLSQIYRENPDDGGTLTDITAGLMGARTAYEGIKAYQNIRSDFEKQYQTGRFADGEGFLEKGIQRVGEKMFGPYSAEYGALYYSELAKKDPSVKDVMSFYDPNTGQQRDIDLTKPIFDKAPERPKMESEIKLPAGAALTGGVSGDNIHTNYGTGVVKKGSAEHRALINKQKNDDSLFLPDLEIKDTLDPIASGPGGKLFYNQEELDAYKAQLNNQGFTELLTSDLRKKFSRSTLRTSVNQYGQTINTTFS